MILGRAHQIVLILCISFLVLVQKANAQKLPSILPFPLEDVYDYDPLNQRFVKRQTLAEQTSGYPLYLSLTEFYEALRRQALKANFQQKTAALSQSNDTIRGARKDLLPTYYVNSDFFESVFGGNTVTVATSGGFNFDTGALIQRTENPALAVRNQRSTILDIDQQFDFNLNAQVGERLNISAAIDSRSTFNFENLFKLTYTPNEDDWLRNLEFGNVNLPLRSSLLSGAQNVFGVRSDFQFGRTRVSAVYGEQRSQRSSVRSENGSVVNRFELSALDYEENTHFFLAHFFRDTYDQALANYPFIASPAQITRIEVWVTNRQQQTDNVRSIIAFQDLAESDPENVSFNAPETFYRGLNALPDNAANFLNPAFIGGSGLSAEIRAPRANLSTINVLGQSLTNGIHFTNLSNARKLEEGVNYTFNQQLGYISLNQPLATDEVLAVAFQYTYNGQVYTVGEFSNDNTLTSDQTLVLKLLKSTITRVEDPLWDLMMKNIYAVGAFGLRPDDFQMQ
ncbi:MAG: cell surface protein SprA, partial [Flavobacteriaceae bacterium]